MTAVAATALALAALAAPSRTVLIPEPLPEYVHAAYAGGYLWVAVGAEPPAASRVWRFGPRGEPVAFALPAGVWPVRVLARGEEAHVLATRAVYRLAAGRAELAFPLRETALSAVRVGDRYAVAVSGAYRVYREGEEPRALEAPGLPVFERSSTLAELDADRFLVVGADPYQVTVVGLDGTVRQLAVDESGQEDVVDRERVERIRFERDLCGEERREYRVRNGVTRDGVLVVSRQVSVRDSAPDGQGYVVPSVAVDLVDLATGRVRERLPMRLEGRTWPGALVGLGGNGELALYDSGAALGTAGVLRLAAPR